MTRIKITEQYKLDYKREKRGRHRARLDKKLFAALLALTADAALPGGTTGQICDLVLNHDLQDCLYYPIRPHFIMIYRKSGDGILELVRLGTHGELSISGDLQHRYASEII